MKIKVYENSEITKENLIKEIHDKGYVVFCSGMTIQRKIAGELINHFEKENISLVHAESDYNFYMCVVDVDRHNYRDILNAATLKDKP